MSSTAKKSQVEATGYPAFVWFLLFLVGPVCLVLLTSFLSRGTYGGGFQLSGRFLYDLR